MNEEITKELHELLTHFWILKEENSEKYYSIKRHQEIIRDFTLKNLGSKLIIHEKFIKLEKIPSIPDANLGLPNFKSSTDYIYLCLVLLFLEDKTKGTYFMLSNLIDYVKNTSVTLELNHVPNWVLSKDRKSLKRAIDFLLDIKAIELRDESKIDFREDMGAEALYVATGLSNYVMRLFNNEIFNYETLNDFVKDEWTYQDDEKGDVRKYKVYRNLIYTPKVLRRDLSESESDYLKKLRGHIHDELLNNLGYELEVTKNMAFVFEYETSSNKMTFPNNTRISDIVLIVNHVLLEQIKLSKIMVDDYEIGYLKKEDFIKILLDIKEQKTSFLTKKLKDLTNEAFCNVITDYMSECGFIKEQVQGYEIYPTIRIFGSKLVNSTQKQLEIWSD